MSSYWTAVKVIFCFNKYEEACQANAATLIVVAGNAVSG